MHRSATSLTARCLHENGEVHMGEDLLVGLSDNPKGHYENKRFLHLNIEILKAAGGDWDRPPSRSAIMQQKDRFNSKIRSLVKQEMEIAKKEGHISWGFKDPRTVLTIDLYMPHLENPQFICCYRDPMDVAKSMLTRNKMPIEKGLKLARTYNSRIHEFMNEWLNKKYS